MSKTNETELSLSEQLEQAVGVKELFLVVTEEDVQRIVLSLIGRELTHSEYDRILAAYQPDVEDVIRLDMEWLLEQEGILP